MRKVVLRMSPGDTARAFQGRLFDVIDSIELVEFLRLDAVRGEKLAIVDVMLREGRSLEEVELPIGLENLSLIRSEGGKHTCLMKAKAPEEFRGLMREFDLDLVWDAPTRITREGYVISFKGGNGDINRFTELIRQFGSIDDISVQPASFHHGDVLNSLTKRQREVLVAAKRSGYYDYPKGISSETLSNELGMSRATLIEHLRKAESRLMASILEGY